MTDRQLITMAGSGYIRFWPLHENRVPEYLLQTYTNDGTVVSIFDESTLPYPIVVTTKGVWGIEVNGKKEKWRKLATLKDDTEAVKIVSMGPRLADESSSVVLSHADGVLKLIPLRIPEAAVALQNGNRQVRFSPSKPSQLFIII